MKKILIVVLVSMLLLTSCGMSWKNFKKDVKSDLGGGLKREIVVSNMLTGEIVWEHSGVSYISDDSAAGDVTVVFYSEDNELLKADFIGEFYGIHAIEE